MKKISTLFKKDPSDLSRVINEVNPENAWVFDEWFKVKATRKFDGTAAAIINGELYKRYDVKKGKTVPPNAIPCQEPDEITGHWPHWVKCEVGNPADKFFFEGFNNLDDDKLIDGTYELCGSKVQENPEGFAGHVLVPHGTEVITVFGSLFSVSFSTIKGFLEQPANNIEGIVFHHSDGRMCKIRKSDFGIKR